MNAEISTCRGLFNKQYDATSMTKTNTNTQHKQKGFTLIELIIVMIIVGILAAIITPKFVDLDTDAKNAARRAMSGAVQSAWAVAIADRATRISSGELTGSIYPDRDQLAEYVHGGSAVAGGIQVDIAGETEIVPTYQGADCEIGEYGAACTAPAGEDCEVATTGPVTCIGSITLQ